jgi:hypothetical protein
MHGWTLISWMFGNATGEGLLNSVLDARVVSVIADLSVRDETSSSEYKGIEISQGQDNCSYLLYLNSYMGRVGRHIHSN